MELVAVVVSVVVVLRMDVTVVVVLLIEPAAYPVSALTTTMIASIAESDPLFNAILEVPRSVFTTNHANTRQ